MDANVMVAIISGVGMILSGWIGFMGNKKGTLATAEKDFRTAILEDNQKLRQRVDELEQKLTSITIEYNRLQVKLIKLQEQYGIKEKEDMNTSNGGRVT
jgi:TolA-binding protein